MYIDIITEVYLLVTCSHQEKYIFSLHAGNSLISFRKVKVIQFQVILSYRFEISPFQQIQINFNIKKQIILIISLPAFLCPSSLNSPILPPTTSTGLLWFSDYSDIKVFHSCCFVGIEFFFNLQIKSFSES